MTKLDLQKELLEKVKPGMKPSDLKKVSKKQKKKECFTTPYIHKQEWWRLRKW